MFRSNARTGNYAQAGKSAADEVVRAFAASRRNAPKYDEMAIKATELRSKEKVAAMKAEQEVALAGIRAKTDVTKKRIVNDATMKRDASKRKAGALAAAGKMIGTAGTLFGDSKDIKKRDTSDAAYANPRIDSARADLEKAEQDIATFNTGVNPETGKRYGGSSGGGLVEPQTDPVSPKVQNAPLPQVAPKTTVAPVSSGPQAKATSTNFQGFVDMAAAAGAKYPQLVAAQWALESGWGKTPSGKNNYFGIKAASGESSTSKKTWEVYGGKEVTTSANFKNYDSPQGSVNDLVSKWHKDYKSYQGVNNASDAFEAADMLRQQGYATDPAYSEKLKKIMRDQGY